MRRNLARIPLRVVSDDEALRRANTSVPVAQAKLSESMHFVAGFIVGAAVFGFIARWL